MSRRAFGDLYPDFIEKNPGKASRSLAELRARLAELDAGAEPRYSTDNAEAKRRMIDRYVAGFRLTSRCEKCGRDLEDPTSVARGIGPDCWDRLERGAQEQAAEPAFAEDAF